MYQLTIYTRPEIGLRLRTRKFILKDYTTMIGFLIWTYTRNLNIVSFTFTLIEP